MPILTPPVTDYRQARGRTLALDKRIKQVEQGMWIVPSQAQGDGRYLGCVAGAGRGAALNFWPVEQGLRRRQAPCPTHRRLSLNFWPVEQGLRLRRRRLHQFRRLVAC